jgi:sugar phosphate isomerase/epimerase
MDKPFSRREFLQTSSAAAWAAGGIPLAMDAAAPTPAPGQYRGTYIFFSKPVPQLNWQELAQATKRAGFGGVDLTVRKGGHVSPPRAEEDLPKAVAAIRAEGLEVPLITTELLRADDPTAEPIIRTAGKLNIPLMKSGYYHWKFVDVRKELAEAGEDFRSLVNLGEKNGVQTVYHNHDRYIGAQVWDMSRIMDTLDPKWAGYYYDLENATIEGTSGGWKVAAILTMPRLKIVGAKDFYWENTKDRDWDETGCPMGKGICRYQEYLKMLAAANYHGPISVHIEYAIPGVMNDQGVALSRDQCDATMAAAQRDLGVLKGMVREAYEGV